MTDGTISGNKNAGVSVGSNWTFTMSGGTIYDNEGSSGGGIVIFGGAFNMVSDDAVIKNNHSTTTLATHGGGGISLLNGTANISAGSVTGNTAARGGGVFVSNTATFTMTGGSITNNTATLNGGGIYSTRASHAFVLPATAFDNLNIGPDAIFSNNSAGNGLSAPPDNTLPHIATTHATRWGNPLNNYDINYTGRLGQEHGVSTWAALRAAVNAAPANRPTTIYILNSFEAPSGTEGNAIVIPADRQITLVSSNTGPANVRVIAQENTHQRHFIVNGSLTLGRNIALSLGTNAGGVLASGEGVFTMSDGSDIIGW